MMEISEIFSTCSQTSVLQDPMVYMCLIFFPFLKYGTCTRNGSFGAFLVKTKSKTFTGHPNCERAKLVSPGKILKKWFSEN